MPVLINIVSDQHLIHKSVKDALSGLYAVKHQLLVSKKWDGTKLPVDILLLDNYITFQQVVSYYNSADLSLQANPFVVLIAPANIIAKAVIESACSHLVIRFIPRSQLSVECLTPVLKFASSHTLEKRASRSDRKHYQSMFDKASNPAFILNSNWEFAKVNPAYRNFWGTKRPRVVRTNFEEILQHPEDFEHIVKALQSHPDREINIVIYLKSTAQMKGTPVRLQMRAVRETKDSAGYAEATVMSYNGSFTDVSGQKFMEDLQVRMNNLAMTYRLARSLAHEIRNPLTNVTLALGQLVEEMPTQDDRQGTEIFLGIINRNVKRIGDLLNQLLQGAEPKQLQLENTDIIFLARQVLSNFDDKLQLHQIETLQQFEQDMYLISLDQDKIWFVITQLLNNAIEAIGKKEGGCITVGSGMANDQFYLYFKDNGVGISEEIKDKLLTPFFTSKNKGLGLGLTSAQSILAEHGALMEVDSRGDSGSVFTLVFPLAASKTGT